MNLTNQRNVAALYSPNKPIKTSLVVCAGRTSGPWDPSEVKRIIAVWCRAVRVIERWIWVTLVSPSVIILSLKFHLKPNRGPETIQTLIHIQVNTLLIMVYAHSTDCTSHRQAVNATSCPAAAVVVLLCTFILHLSSFKLYELVKAETDTLIIALKLPVKSISCRYSISYNMNILMPKYHYFLCFWLLRVSWRDRKPLKVRLYHSTPKSPLIWK